MLLESCENVASKCASWGEASYISFEILKRQRGLDRSTHRLVLATEGRKTLFAEQ